ncbi:MAG: serine/threonine-protein kinase [Candidatus Obscuribacterales bacterium]|nr:serine/threonine-protein kinase [Candidatus Obscuribacterales bacterium]
MGKYDTGETRVSQPAGAEPPRLTPPKPTSASEEIIGQTLDERFRIVERIGQGGMSAVYKADHLLLERPVAVKFLLKHLCGSAETALRFQREARALSTLDHPNVVKVHAFGVTPSGNLYLVMDFIQACNLADYLKETGPLPQDKALPLFKDVCQGLLHIHQRGVVHRDLKPANIVLAQKEDASTNPIIVDFGLATVEERSERKQRLTEAGSTCGSPPYMSPEQCLGNATDARSDIYSLGCLFFEVITGRYPFTGNTGSDIMMQHLNAIAPRFQEVATDIEFAPSLEAIVQKCLSKNPDERYPDVAELLVDLQQVGTGSEREDTLDSILEPAVQKPRSKGFVPLIVLSFTVMVVVAIGIFVANLFSPEAQTTALRKQVDQLLTSSDTKFSDVRDRTMELVLAYETAGNKVEAQRVLKKLEQSARRILGAHSREYAQFWIDRSLWLRARGNEGAAVTADSAAIDALSRYAVVSAQEGDFLAQKTALTDCIRLSKNSGQPKSKMVQFLYALATYYKSANDYARAEDLTKTIMETCLSMPESNQKRESVMMAQHNLAEIYLCQARFKEALPLFANVENTARGIFGRNSQQHKETVKRLAHCHQQMGNAAMAKSLLNSIQ